MVLFLSGVMFGKLLFRITPLLTSLGLGQWFSNGAEGSSVSGSRSSLASSPDSQVLFLSKEIDSWMALPEQSFNNMPFPLQLVMNALNSSKSISLSGGSSDTSSTIVCGSCRLLTKMMIGYLNLGGPIDLFADFIIKICYVIAYQSLPVCRGLINQDKDRLVWILRNAEVESDEICSLLLGSQGCGLFLRTPWTINLPKPELLDRHVRSSLLSSPRITHVQSSDVSPQQVQPKQQQQLNSQAVINNPNEGLSDNTNGKRALKVLHLTDPHFDPHYRVGSNAVCEAPLCCNEDSGTPKRPGDAAGKWGDYRDCDSPRWLLQHMLQNIVTNHPDVDYIMCTGDLVPHHIWKVSKKENLAVMAEMTNMLLEYFPNIPIYGAIGNHESFPRDSFPPPEEPEVWEKFGTQWLYDALAEQWGKLMGGPTPDMARFAGYYSVLVRPGFRIISINTNYCYKLNWWLLYKSVDPGLVLRWLVSELQKAETRGEIVHLIGHIPPYYTDCYAQWAHEFSRIVSRYSHIIRGQFYGHSHLDEFRVHYDVDNLTKPIGVQYITPNNGPFVDLNPSYRVFYVDGDHPDTTRNILDYETWVMNLTHANTYDAPHWYRLYTARRDLQLPSLEPQHWNNLVKKMAEDPKLFANYFRYQNQDSDSALAKGCDAACRRKALCDIIEGDRLMPHKCRSRG